MVAGSGQSRRDHGSVAKGRQNQQASPTGQHGQDFEPSEFEWNYLSLESTSSRFFHTVE